MEFIKKERKSIAERYNVYTCNNCKVQRSSDFIYPATRICYSCHTKKFKFTKEELIRMRKLSDELNEIMDF